MQAFAQRIVSGRFFEYFIIGIILFSAVLIGLETSRELTAEYSNLLIWGNRIVLGIFIIEAMLKMCALAPKIHRYFHEGWNIFDFSIIVLALIPSTGELAILARLARLLRVLRLISTIPELRLIVTTLIRSIPSMGHVILLMSIIFYIYGIAGYHLFHEHDPIHWETLGLSLLTLFRIVTLEDWTDVMYTAMEMNKWAWIYFVSFVFMGTFVIINLFIAVVLNNLDQAKEEQLNELRKPVGRDELLKELAETQRALARLRERMEKME